MHASQVPGVQISPSSQPLAGSSQTSVGSMLPLPQMNPSSGGMTSGGGKHC